MAPPPDDDDHDSMDDGDDPLGFDPEERESSSHSESVFVIDDEEAGRESFLARASLVFEQMVERAAFAEDVGSAYVDADPQALDAAAGIASAVEQAKEAGDVARRHLRGLLEALLFVSDRPMKTADLAEIARSDTKEVRTILEALSEEYREQHRGFQLDELAGGFQIRTSAAFAPFVRELTQAKPIRLSRAQVETLAIIAYRQPITRPEIEDIRGVDAGAVLKLLLDRDMLRVLGKKDEPGRPLLYGTTSHFLTFFGLKSLKDLPTLREFTELTEEHRDVVEHELGEVLPDGPREPAVAEERGGERSNAEEQPVVEDGVREADNDTEAENEAESENEPEVGKESGDAPKPGGSQYDPADEKLYPDDDDEDDADDEDDGDADDEDDDEEDGADE